MLKLNYSLLLFLLTFTLNAQTAESINIDINNIKAVLRVDGGLFLDPVSGKGFVAPARDGNNTLSTMKASGLWMTAEDPAGNIKGAVQVYNEGGKRDFVPFSEDYNKIWTVSKADILAHIADLSDNGVIDNQLPAIYSWPGNRNPFFEAYNGFAQDISIDEQAPFFDRNADGIYNPEQGDYPRVDVRSCELFDHLGFPDIITWHKFTDDTEHTESGLNKMDIEVHVQAFAYNCLVNPVIDNTLFVSHTLINRGIEGLNNVHLGIFTDFTLGCPQDDYVGLSASQDMAYVYNSDDFDEACGTFTGYQAATPVMMVKTVATPLNDYGDLVPLMHCFPFGFDDSNQGAPNSGMEYYRYLHGQWRDGSIIPDDGLLYDGNPNDPTANTELAAGNTPGRRRILMVHEPFQLPPGYKSFPLINAYSFFQMPSASNLENVQTMYDSVELIQHLFFGCIQKDDKRQYCEMTTATDQLDSPSIQLRAFPNPSSDLIHISTGGLILDELHLYNAQGQLVKLEQIHAPNHEMLVANLPTGIYYLKALVDNEWGIKKVVVSR